MTEASNQAEGGRTVLHSCKGKTRKDNSPLARYPRFGSVKHRAHSLPSFSSWLNKGFDLRSLAGQMTDARTDPEISPSSIFLAFFHSFVFRLPSFQQLDSELSHSYFQHWIGAERAVRDDTLRYSLCGFDLAPLEAMLVDVNRRLKRGKAFDEGRVQGRLVAALDGIEVLSSFSRRCDSCLQRRVSEGSGRPQGGADSVLPSCRRLPDGPQPGQAISRHRMAPAG